LLRHLVLRNRCRLLLRCVHQLCDLLGREFVRKNIILP
jgi:hypothetical protein